MAVDALADKLLLLVAEGSLAASRLTDRDRSRLQSLFATGVLATERSGAGKKVVVKNREALDAFVLRSYPSGLHEVHEQTRSLLSPSTTNNSSTFQDSCRRNINAMHLRKTWC